MSTKPMNAENIEPGMQVHADMLGLRKVLTVEHETTLPGAGRKPFVTVTYQSGHPDGVQQFYGVGETLQVEVP